MELLILIQRRQLQKNGTANCHAKSELLERLFIRLGYHTRQIIMLYQLKDYPAEVRYIPHRHDFHYVPQVLLSDEWVSVDATYDPPLAKLGFTVNEWDGIHSTPLAEEPIIHKVVGEPDTNFDRTYAAFVDELNEAYGRYPEQIVAYQTKFNAWLNSARQ